MYVRHVRSWKNLRGVHLDERHPLIRRPTALRRLRRVTSKRAAVQMGAKFRRVVGPSRAAPKPRKNA